MRFKKGIKLEVVKEITELFPLLDHIYDTYQKECVITCGSNGVHSKYSRHYCGCAIDLRSRDFNSTQKKMAIKDIKMGAGKNYFVLSHKTHIHLAYKPTR